MRKFINLIGVVAALFSAPASAYDWSVQGKVTGIEVTYAPGNLPFKLDTAAGSCSAGSWLYWTPQGSDSVAKAQNYQAVLSVLMTAKSSGQTVIVFGNSSGCTINYIYLQ